MFSFSILLADFLADSCNVHQMHSDEKDKPNPKQQKTFADVRSVAATLGHIQGMREVVARDDVANEREQLHVPPVRLA